MAQGNKKAKSTPYQKQKPKGKAFTRKANAPIQSKKAKFAESQKLKQIVTKNVNRSVEIEIRSRAVTEHTNLSNAQKAVAKMHKKDEAASTSTNKKP